MRIGRGQLAAVGAIFIVAGSIARGTDLSEAVPLVLLYVVSVAAVFSFADSLRRRSASGAKAQTESASPHTAQIDLRRDQVSEFVRRVMYLDPEEYYLTDDSTIEDLQRGHDNREYFARARGVYDVDISDIQPLYLWAIARRIEERRAIGCLDA